ncbi:aspartic proteinase CDR1-like [Telopea speciosissima]|uniref:aspartic proteinase CDR1-like n=1 Tax=Telopea speciosissima TaxID=54955 RepID=UPI001CC7B501|nr:aspartic proteinase CDR1-like [Telopea speciosissima]
MTFMETLLSLISLLSSALLLHAVVEGPKAITLTLIHPFSPHSPFYPGNITDVEKINLLIQGTEAHMHHLFSTMREGNLNGSSEVDDIVTQVQRTGAYYVAQVGIGSFPPVPGPKTMPYFLIMDTGSHTTWVQCEGCNRYVSQGQPNYPYKRSQSYKPIPCGDPTCPTPNQDCFQSFCGFRIHYSVSTTGPLIVGSIIRETLTFPSDFRGTESYNNLFLGCGIQYVNFNYAFGGILGIGPGGLGPRPLWDQVGKKRFSYCLVPSEQPNYWLYIGGEKMVGQQVQSTSLLRGSHPSLYYLELQDISIANVHLGLQGSFSGGCAIDTRAGMTSLVSNVYARVRIGLI